MALAKVYVEECLMWCGNIEFSPSHLPRRALIGAAHWSLWLQLARNISGHLKHIMDTNSAGKDTKVPQYHTHALLLWQTSYTVPLFLEH